MSRKYFTLTGTHHYYGKDFMEVGMDVFLEKEKDNPYDSEAIQIKMKGLGIVGYVANSPYTVLGKSYSAGRLYDQIGFEAKGKILHILEKGVLCVLEDSKDESSTIDEDMDEENISKEGLIACLLAIKKLTEISDHPKEAILDYLNEVLREC